jgi:hypothetical protein
MQVGITNVADPGTTAGVAQYTTGELVEVGAIDKGRRVSVASRRG